MPFRWRFGIACVALIAAAALPAPAIGATAFFDPEEFPDTGSTDVAVDDLNGDNAADIVGVSGYASNAVVTAWLGDGEGGFATPDQTPLPTASPGELTLGDVTGDDVPDAVVVQENGGKVILFEGTGDGGFEGAEQVAELFNAVNVVIGDFGGSDKPDLATVTDWPSGFVRPFIQQSDGTFAAGTDLSTATGARIVKTEDLDGNGYLDLVVLGQSSATVSVHRQDSSGFAAPVSYQTGAFPTDVTFDELTGDSNLDMVVADGGNTVSIFNATTPGVFAARTSVATANGPTAIESSDLDGDDDQDLIVRAYDNPTIHTLIAGTGGSFTSTPAGNSGLPGHYRAMAMADFDQDGEDDLVVSQFQEGIGVLYGDVLHAEPSVVFFEPLQAGVFSEETVLLRNTGSVAVTPGAPATAAPFSVRSSTCGSASLAVRAACSTTVRFTAIDENADHQDFLDFPGDANSGPRSVPLDATSTRTPGPRIGTFSDRAFMGRARVGEAGASRSLRITSAGDQPLSGITIAVRGSAFVVLSNSCAGAVLDPGRSCYVRLSFQPKTAGVINGDLRVTGNGASPVTVALFGYADRVYPTRQGTPRSVIERRVRDRMKTLLRGLPKLLRGGPAKLRKPALLRAAATGRYRLLIEARAGRKWIKIGKASANIRTGRSKRLAFRLSKRGRRLLAGRKTVSVRGTMTLDEVGFRRITVSRVLKVKPKRRYPNP